MLTSASSVRRCCQLGHGSALGPGNPGVGVTGSHPIGPTTPAGPIGISAKAVRAALYPKERAECHIHVFENRTPAPVAAHLTAAGSAT